VCNAVLRPGRIDLSRKIRETFVLVPLIREKSRHITVRARLA